MDLLVGLRSKIGQYFLNKLHADVTRNRKICNLSEALNIGIVYEALDKDSFEAVRDFYEVLKQEKKNVKIIGYVPARKNEQDFMLNLDIDQFKWTDVNWYFKPNIQKANDFSANEFDILIDLTLNNCLPLTYITALSKAKFIVGRYNEDLKDFYDLMIIAEKGEEIKSFVASVRKYLMMINNVEHKA